MMQEEEYGLLKRYKILTEEEVYMLKNIFKKTNIY
jgi:hypothetical protein